MSVYEEEIKLEESTSHRDGNTYSHPSYGMVSVCRTTSSHDRALFGSEVKTNNTMVLRVEKARVTQDLGRNWYYGSNIITEVEMTPVQYAELISNPNTQGVPCTIKTTQELGRIEYKGIETVTQHVESVIDTQLEDMKKDLSELNKKVRELTSKKGALNKSDREEINQTVSNVAGVILSSLPFYEEQLNKSINQAKMEAKTEVESYMQNAINRVGLKALQNEDVLKLVLDNK